VGEMFASTYHSLRCSQDLRHNSEETEAAQQASTESEWEESEGDTSTDQEDSEDNTEDE